MSANKLIQLINNKSFTMLVNINNSQSSVSMHINNASVRIDEECLFIENQNRDNLFVDLKTISNIDVNDKIININTDNIEVIINME